jgi:hypothetical protein
VGKAGSEKRPDNELRILGGITNNSGLFNISIVLARGIRYLCILEEAVLVHGGYNEYTYL